MVCARLLVLVLPSSLCLYIRLNFPILLLTSLLVSMRFLILRERTPPGAYTPPASYASWCLHASGFLMSKRLLVSARPGLLFLCSPGVC